MLPGGLPANPLTNAHRTRLTAFPLTATVTTQMQIHNAINTLYSPVRALLMRALLHQSTTLLAVIKKWGEQSSKLTSLFLFFLLHRLHVSFSGKIFFENERNILLYSACLLLYNFFSVNYPSLSWLSLN